MRSIFISWLAVISPCLAIAQLNTPSVPNSVGFDLPVVNSSFTISIGEPAVSTLTSSSTIITQGYLQPIDPSPCNNIEFSYYPNPATEFIHVSVVGCDDEINAIQIIDIWGRVITTVQDLPDDRIYIGDLSQGLYVFNVSLKQGNRGSFSAIKVIE